MVQRSCSLLEDLGSLQHVVRLFVFCVKTAMAACIFSLSGRK